jgi:uncharacterized membrane protein
MNEQPPSSLPPSSLPPQAQPAPRSSSAISRGANSLVIWVARHWLALFNTAWALYVFTPFLAPILMRAGMPEAAQVIYTVYSVFCHQLPDHSYFLFGPALSPQDPALIAAGMSSSSNLFQVRSFIGSPEIGWKVALCQRDVAIYASVFLTGLLYGAVRHRVRRLPFKIYVLFVIPIAIDGLTQLVGWRESNWWLRTVTGALFGFASVWFAYPYLEEAMEDVLEDELLPRHSPAP